MREIGGGGNQRGRTENCLLLRDAEKWELEQRIQQRLAGISGGTEPGFRTP